MIKDKTEPVEQPDKLEQLESIESTIKDLVDVEPKSFGDDKQAKEAGTWVQFVKQTETEVDEILDPSIKKAFAAHKALTGSKKKLIEKLIAAKDRVRVNLANWIAGKNKVEGFYIKKKWRVVVEDEKKLPDEYFKVEVDQEKLDEWATKTEGKVAIAGCEIKQVNILYASAEK
jgi:hypothetical protein